EAAEKAKVAAEANDPSGDSGWQQIVSAASLEDEVKRTRLAFDATVTSPGAFKSKGHREARQQLSVLATLFAVINDYTGDIRWKSQAAVARDLIARTALSCNAGSTQSYNEAKIRKAELQELVSGRGFEGRTAEPQNDWAMIVDRTPLMVYGESLLEALQDDTRDEKSYRAAPDDVLRQSELLAMLGRVLVQEGLDDADDEDYAAHSNKMSDAAISVLDAIRRDDFDAIRRGVGAISQSCAACHEDYR
ncbi:MAG: cytochrome c, partial [Planctomycetota bacterium]